MTEDTGKVALNIFERNTAALDPRAERINSELQHITGLGFAPPSPSTGTRPPLAPLRLGQCPLPHARADSCACLTSCDAG